MTHRNDLIASIRAAKEIFRQQGADAWNRHVERLRSGVDDNDRYWLEDRIQDEECELGLLPHPSHVSHLLASRGLAYLGDTRPQAGPFPYFALFRVAAVEGAAPEQDRGHGGIGPSTWGYLLSTHTGWFAHAIPGAPEGEIERGLARMRHELASAGIRVDESAEEIP